MRSVDEEIAARHKCSVRHVNMTINNTTRAAAASACRRSRSREASLDRECVLSSSDIRRSNRRLDEIASYTCNPVTAAPRLFGRTSRQERNFSPRRPAPQFGLVRRQEQRDRKLRAQKPANGGPWSQVSTKCRIARLGGGGRSPSRTGLHRQIPC